MTHIDDLKCNSYLSSYSHIRNILGMNQTQSIQIKTQSIHMNTYIHGAYTNTRSLHRVYKQMHMLLDPFF